MGGTVPNHSQAGPGDPDGSAASVAVPAALTARGTITRLPARKPAIASAAKAEAAGGKLLDKNAAIAVQEQAVARSSRAKTSSLGIHTKVPAFVSRHWPYMPVVLSLCILFSGVLGWSLPPIESVIAGLAAIAVPLAAPAARRIELRDVSRFSLRLGLMVLVVFLPMFLFGFAMTWWAAYGALQWPIALGVLVVASALSAVVQNGRATALFSAQLALWSAVLIVNGSRETYILLATCFVVALQVSRIQLRLERLAAEKEQKRERLRLRAEDILRDYEETGQGWFWETDRRGQLIYISYTVARVLGQKDPDVFIGKPLTELFDLFASGEEGERTLIFHLSVRSSFQELAVRANVQNEERWWSISGRPIYDDFDNFVGFRGSGTDLTEKKRSQENAQRLAHYDSLTGLANRFQMALTLEKILNAQQEIHRACTVFLLDLDRFKQVNDTMGHPAGDALLKQVSKRLVYTVGDRGRVGRLGGDEFEILLAGRIGREESAELAERIIHSLSEPYSIDGHRVTIGVSVGISLSPDDGVTSEALIRNADLALYAAKDGGRGRFHFYADDLHSEAEERRQLEQDLRDAIANGGLELAYQPVVSTATERITGFEALMRWNHPTLGALPPQKFIEIAEDSGLIGAMGEWALRTACHDLAQWPESVRVAVNVSPLQFANPQLPAVVTNAIAHAGIDPGRLELEITESVFLDDSAETDAMFAALKRVGVRLALDDFGTGYSSLGYLKKAPFDKIKIDQSFVRGVTEKGSRNGAIIAAITSLAHALGMDTTAEGVETLDELDLVRMHGCSHVQGYIYEQALSASAATSRLKTGLAAIARGPRSARPPRQMMLRKVILKHEGHVYHGTIRNISVSGAMVEGLWNVPVGTVFKINLSSRDTVNATCRWCQDDRIGVEFERPLRRDESGRIAAVREDGGGPDKKSIRR